MKFTKMHGCGNDYIYIDEITQSPIEHNESLIQFLCQKHYGIGGDGVIFIQPSEIADFKMTMYNEDGTAAEMCGNGIRCVAKYVYEHHLINHKDMTIESGGKIKHLHYEKGNNQQKQEAIIMVNMGKPEYASNDFLTTFIEIADKKFEITNISMGNPHAVVFVENVEDFLVEEIGPQLEFHKQFPNKTNVEFVQVIDRKHIKMRVWERGTGETLACGTGSCAAVVACVLKDLTEEKVTVTLLGGTLLVDFNRRQNTVYMMGPAMTVFEGDIDL